MFWPQSHNNVLRTILGKAKRGTKVIFVPGNHDEVFREFDGAVFGNLEIHREYVHEGADGRRMLVLHGDEFDSVVKCSPWLAKLGSNIYDMLLAREPLHQLGAPLFGLPHWSLSVVPQEQGQDRRPVHRQLRGRGRAGGAQARRRHRGLRPYPPRRNARDQRRSCTATTAIGWRAAARLVEDMNGQLRLIDWPKLREQLPARRSRSPVGQAA